MVGRPYQRIDEVAHNIMLEVDKRQDVCYYMFMIKTPQNTNIPQKILYNSGEKSMGFRKANEASDSEVRRAGFERFAKKAGAVAVIAIAALGSLKAAESLTDVPRNEDTTVKVFDKIVKKSNKNPNALSVDEKKVLSDFEKISIQPGETAWDMGLKYYPNEDPRGSSDRLIAQDDKNFKQGIGEEGFNIGDQLIVPKAPIEK